MLLKRLPPGADVLDLGCGAGLPSTACLARRFTVTGIDISPSQVERARLNVPGATFINADMTAVHLPESSFDAVVAFYSIVHVPRDQHATLLRSIASWLRPGGLLTTAMTVGSGPADHAHKGTGWALRCTGAATTARRTSA